MADMALGAAPAGLADGRGGAATRSRARAEVLDTRTTLLLECDAMLRYALGNGLRVPADLLAELEPLDDLRAARQDPEFGLPRVAALHNRLARVVAPATPRTIYLLDTDPCRDTMLGALGPLPNIRGLMGAATLFVALFVGLALSPLVSSDTMSKDFYDMSGLTLLTVLAFLMSAAGLGACFNALFTAYGYVSKGTYDQRYDSSYWIRIGLGVIAGLLLAELVPVDSLAGDGEAPDLSKPLLALLGGFSANMVYVALDRLVTTIQSLFTGDPRATLALKAEAARVQVEQQSGDERIQAAVELVSLREALSRGAPAEEVAALASRALSRLMPGVTPPAPGGGRGDAG